MKGIILDESKTKRALRWINEAPGRTQYSAARLFGIAQSAISVAMQKQSENVRLWNVHKTAIERAEATLDSRHTAHIPHKEHLRALRGRDVVREMEGRATCQPARKPSRTSDALDWMDVNGGSVREASERFGVGPAALYSGKRTEEGRMRALHDMGPELCDRIAKYAEENPTTSYGDLARYFDVDMNVMRDALIARETLRRRLTVVREPSEWHKGYAASKEQCAMIAEMVGGEYGAAIAAAIRSMPA